VLDAMVAAYKEAASYDDAGYMELQYQLADQPRGDSATSNFMVAMARPNKIRVQAHDGVAVSDGEKLWGAVREISDQVLQRDAPAEITLESLSFNHSLADALARGPTQMFSFLPPQLILLLSDDPLKTLLYESSDPVLIESAKIDEHECHRVEFKRKEGTGVFWIDQETSVLRRFEFPSDLLRTLVAESYRVPVDQIQNLSLVAEFNKAQLDGEIEPMTFEFQAPPEMQRVDEFLPEDIRWLGKPVPKFSFVDLDGNPITRDWMAGKIAVLDFWASWCRPCRETLPDLEQVYQKYKDNDKVVFVAVSQDKPDVPDEALRDTFTQLGVNVPIARDPEQHGSAMLRVHAYPTSLILGSDGAVEFRQSRGDWPGLGAVRLSARLETLLAGESLHQETLQRYDETHGAQKRQFQKLLAKCLEEDLYVFRPQEIPRAEIVPRSDPKSLRMTQLWTSTELAAPGNVLVVERPDQPPRILVLEEGKSVAEMATKGNVVSAKPLGVPPEEIVSFLRPAAGADGKRRFVGSATGLQQVHLWDDDFNLLLSFPKDALEKRHAGIADARIADLTGDGVLEMVVSYLGIVGVQGVSLEGERTWRNRRAIQSVRLALLGPDDQGRRSILTMNLPEGSPSTLVVLDSKGEYKGEFSLPNRSVAWIEAADLDGDGQPEICGLAPAEGGNMEAVGLNVEGEELWSYPLPPGVHEHQIEAVTAGKLLPGSSAQWLLPAADGTIHILDAAGKPIDVFAYGKPLTGLATAEWDGKRVLLVSTPESVDAWQVEPPKDP